MITQSIRKWLRSKIAYTPRSETESVRHFIDSVAEPGLPYCPPSEGDFIHALIRESNFGRCIETGFYTGSTALYMANAVSQSGDVTSICLDDDAVVSKGRNLLKNAGLDGRHTLLRENSTDALMRMAGNGERFDFAFVDGWKTFDHLTVELYALNRMLPVGGAIFFDDGQMPSVRRAARLLRSYYGYTDISPTSHGIDWRCQMADRITRHTIHMPYIALRKKVATDQQSPFKDFTFDRAL